MMSAPKHLIPVPLSRRLHALRMKIVPVMVFAAAVMMAVMLWRDAVSPAMLTGEVLSAKSSVNSPVGAQIVRLNARTLDHVKAGDVLAELRPTDPRQTLDLLSSELSLLRIEADSGSDQLRQDVSYERLRLAWLEQKVALATAQVRVKFAEIELQRTNNLAAAEAVSQRDLRLAQQTKEAADTEVGERRKLVDDLGAQIEHLKREEAEQATRAPDRLQQALVDFEERLRQIEQNHSVVTLHAPMDGQITAVLRGVGENVTEGEPLVLITAAQPERIIGYLRHPLPLEPQPGQRVEVRTHSREHQRDEAVVTRVGVHFEPIINPALHPAPTPEVGVPVEVSLPPRLHLRPGEIVSLVVRPEAAARP